jgi:DNA repair protein RadD
MSGIDLRPYQLSAVDRARDALRRGCRRLLVVAPTGAGKTVIGAHIVLSARERGRRAIFVAHRRELVNQTFRKLVEAGIPEHEIGVLMGNDQRARPDAPIQVVSISTYMRRQPPAADLVIIDEAHRSLSPSYLALIKRYADAGARVLGLTATPFRANGDGLGDVYEHLVLVARPRELIDAGFLVAPRVFSGGEPDLAGVHTRGGDYLEHELEAAMNRTGLVGGIVEHWQRLAGGRRTVAFASGVEHSQAIAVAFVAAGVPAEHLDGTTPVAKRDAILARLKRGETLVVSNCGVLTEGWDQPECKGLILARPTKSLGLYMQMAGRVLRPWNDVRPIILDHAGNALQHGLPHDDRDFSLDGAKASGAAPTRECPECSAIIALGATQCSECGHEFPRPPTKRERAVQAPGELHKMCETRQVQQHSGARATRGQLAALKRAGYSWRELQGLTVARASAVLTSLAERRGAGLCTLKQAKLLRRFGHQDDLSYDEARRAITALEANGWRRPAKADCSSTTPEGAASP